MEMIIDLLKAGLGEIKSDFIIENGNLVNVITKETYPADVAIWGSKIVAIGKVDQCAGSKTKIVDAKGGYLVPGLIDAHLHVEVAKITMTKLAQIVLPRGTTAIMTLLDQTAAVSGIEGVRATLDEARTTALKLFNIPPLKLPITIPQSTARKFDFDDATKAIEFSENVGFCLENEDFLIQRDPDVARVIDLAHSKGILVQGCCPRLTGCELSSHVATGMRSDHEMVSPEETLERLRNGVYAFMREAPMAHNLRDCIKAITKNPVSSRRACFCGDDWESRDFVELGHVDHMIKLAVEEGLDPVEAIQMATLNTAEAYRVDHIVGSITPGRSGDLIIVDSLDRFNIKKVFANGDLVATDGKMLKEYPSVPVKEFFHKSFNIKTPVSPEEIKVRVDKDAKEAEVITIDHSRQTVVKYKTKQTLKVKNGIVSPDIDKDVLYVTVAERHFGTGSKSTGFITGYGLKSGAFATSYHPEDSNIIVIGTNPEDIAFTINYISEVKGAQAVIDHKKVVEAIHLPIGGIRADISAEEMASKEIGLEEALRRRGATIDRPFAMMLFLALTALPELAITDKGLVDFDTKKYIDPIVKVLK